MKPLAGRTILVTRSREQAVGLGRALAGQGARVIEAPVVGFEEPRDWGPADQAIARLERYDWILFTSVNAVERFIERMAARGADPDRLGRARLAAIGKATAEAMHSRGLEASLSPSVFRAEGVIEALLATGSLEGLRLLIPRAEVAREFLPERLREEGAEVEVVPVYRTVALPVPGEIRDRIGRGEVDMVTFTSGSTVANLLAGLGGAGALSGVAIAVIGEVTAEAAREHGLHPAVIARRATMEDLVAAVTGYYASR